MNKILLILAICHVAFQAAAAPDSAIQLEPCHIANYSQEVLCGSHTVFEDRAKNSGREIEINFTVIPAISEIAEPDPLLMLPGGPGQAATEMGAFIRLAFREINRTRDIVLIDQRGMGRSHPLLCDLPELTGDGLQADFSEQDMRESLKQCLDSLDADVTLYTQHLANQDIHEILIKLGYQQVNIYGVSWGTRAAHIYSQQFPTHIRSMILDGNAPYENRVPLFADQDAERVLRLTLADCAAEQACNTAFPELERQFREAIDYFGEEPVQVTLPDPTTAEEVTFTFTRNSFVNALRAILYTPSLVRLVPIILDQATRGDYRALTGISAYMASQQFFTRMGIGATLTILCSEELSRISDTDISLQSQSGFVGTAFIDVYRNACSVWPKASYPKIYTQPVKTNIPVLLLSGHMDPVTPPRWGNKMAEHYPNSLHLIASNTGHNVAPVKCADTLMAKFVDAASVTDIDGDCLLEIKRPSFFTSLSGPGGSNQND